METSTEFQDTELKHGMNDTVALGQNFLDTDFKQAIDYIQGIFCIFGSVLNLLSIFILSRPDMDTVFNRLLTFLALFDLGYVFSYGLLEFGVLSGVEGWSAGEGKGFSGVILLIFHTICLFSYKASSFVTMAASVERYIAVTYPIKCKEYNVDVASRRRMSCLYIIPVVLLSIASILPGLYWYDATQVNSVLDIDLHRTKNKAYCLFLFILLHDIVLITLNYKIYVIINKASDKKSCLILLLIVALSIISHIFCYVMAAAKWPLSTESPPLWYKYVTEICVLFAVFNCSVNFFIYNFAAHKFRSIFLEYFFCRSNEIQEPCTMRSACSEQHDRSPVEKTGQKTCKGVHSNKKYPKPTFVAPVP